MERAEDSAAELEALNREKSEIIQILAHELFTPITTIQGFALTLLQHEEGLDRSEIRALAAGVQRASGRLRRLVGNLSAAARLERENVLTDTCPVRVGDVLEQACLEFEAVREELRLPTDSEILDRRIWADSELAARAVSIVLENALAFSDDEPAEVEVIVREPALWILVSDRGSGIPVTQHDRIFDAFTQADSSPSRPHQGLGIGLHLAWRITRAHRGEIRVRPRNGGGTTFVLSFPLVMEDVVRP